MNLKYKFLKLFFLDFQKKKKHNGPKNKSIRTICGQT